MAVPVIDYQVLADTLLNNIAAAGGVAPGAAAGAGAAHGDTTVRYSGDHMDIERVESAMKKFLSENCVDTNATVLQNIRTFLDHVSNVFKIEVCLYDTRDDMERLAPDAVDTNAFSKMVERLKKEWNDAHPDWQDADGDGYTYYSELSCGTSDTDASSIPLDNDCLLYTSPSPRD